MRRREFWEFVMHNGEKEEEGIGIIIFIYDYFFISTFYLQTPQMPRTMETGKLSRNVLIPG